MSVMLTAILKKQELLYDKKLDIKTLLHWQSFSLVLLLEKHPTIICGASGASIGTLARAGERQ